VIRKHFFFSKNDRRGSIKQARDTIEMKNINTKRKTESDIKISKDWLSTIGESRRYWSLGDVNAPGNILFSARTNFKQDYELIH
jgi:hypothetical protein